MAAPEIVDGHVLIGRRVSLPGHFDDLDEVEAMRRLGAHFELRVRRSSGQLEEAMLSAAEVTASRREGAAFAS